MYASSEHDLIEHFGHFDWCHKDARLLHISDIIHALYKDKALNAGICGELMRKLLEAERIRM